MSIKLLEYTALFTPLYTVCDGHVHYGYVLA